MLTATTVQAHTAISIHNYVEKRESVDYNSDEFKKELCGLVQEGASLVNETDKRLDELRALATPGEKQATHPPAQQMLGELVALLKQQNNLIDDFVKAVKSDADAGGRPGWRTLATVLALFSPYIEQELKSPKYANKTVFDFILETEFDSDGRLSPSSAICKLINAAAARQKPLGFRTNPIVKTLYPMDKMNSVTYGRSVEDYEKTLEINVASKKSDKTINVTYSVNFEALDASVSRSLSHFDKQVCIAAAAHYAAGNNVVSLSQIHTAMGGTGRPSPSQIARIGASVDKLAKTEITIDNTEEAIAYKGRKKVVDKEMIITCKRRDAYINGHLTEGAIFMFDLPAPIRFARDRGQIITLDLKVLQSPMNKTEENLILQDYLIRRISRKGDPRRILMSTLLSKIGVRGSRQKKWRALEKVKALLEYYKEIGFIADFKLEPDAICIEQPVKKRIPAASR